MRAISDLKDSVSAKLSGIDLQNVDNLYGAFETAARVFMQKAKIPETQIKQQLYIYSGVTDYLANEMLFGKSVIDIQPQGITRQSNDFVWLQYQSDFDRMKQYVQFGTKSTFDYNNGTPIIRIVSSYSPAKLILEPMNSITGWAADGVAATNLVADISFYYQAPASLRFNLNSGHSQGTLTKTINSVNLTTYQNTGVVFLAIEIPNIMAFASFELKLGSDSANYYLITNTAGTLGNVSGQFMLMAFDLSLAITVGSPDISKITYIQVLINYDGTQQNNVRCGDLFISLPTPVTIIYSAAAFFSVGGVISNTITANTDIIVLNDAAYTIYEYECCVAVLEQVGGATADSMIARIDGKLNSSYTRTGKILTPGLYDEYKAENPSEILRTVGSYYNNSNPYRGGTYGR